MQGKAPHYRRKDPSLNQITKRQDSEIATLPNFQHQTADFLQEETLLARFAIPFNELAPVLAQYLSGSLAAPLTEDQIGAIDYDTNDDGDHLLVVEVPNFNEKSDRT